jgi:hypothetical protein
MQIDVLHILYSAQTLSPLVGFIAYFIVTENVPRQNHLIFVYLVVCFIADVFTYFQMIPGPIVFNIHDICQFLVVIIIYVTLLKQRAVFFLAITILLYLIGIIATIVMIGINVYHNYMWALSGFLLSTLCMVYLNVVNVRAKEFGDNKDIYNTLAMNASFLFYFLATFLFFLYADWVFKEKNSDMLGFMWAYHNVIGIMKNIGLAVAIFLTGKAKALETTTGE